MQDTRSDFEKTLDPNTTPGPSAIVEKPAATLRKMDGQLDHTRPLTVGFRCRYHAQEAWSCIKNILETCQVDQQTAAVMMESMSTLAEAIDDDVNKERKEKEEHDGSQQPHLIGE